MENAKITPTRAAAIYNFLAGRDPRDNGGGSFTRRMGGAFQRMMETMVDEGLWLKAEPKHREQRAKMPVTPDILRNGPTAKALRAFIEQGHGMSLREKIEARIVNLCEAEALHETAMQAWRTEQAEHAARNRAARNERKAAAVRALLAENGIDVGDRDDASLLVLIDSIIETEMNS